MKITTRAVYDMTDPRFWGDDFEQAKVSEESFEYEGPVALCSMHDGPGTGRDSDGTSGGGNGGNGESTSSDSNGRDNANDSVDGSWGGVTNAGTFDSNGNRTAYASGSPTSYGVANYSREHNVPWSRANEALQDQHINSQYAQRRAAALSLAARTKTSVAENIQSTFNPSTMAALDAKDALDEGRIGDLSSMGVMSDPQVNSYADAYGGFGYQAGTGLGINMAAPEDVQTPEESFTSAIDSGLIGADGSLTAKGYFKAYAPIAALAAAPAAMSMYAATASVPAAIATGVGLQLAGDIASSPIGDDSGVAGINPTSLATTAISGMTGIPTNMVSYASNLGTLAAAHDSVNPGGSLSASGSTSTSDGSDMSAADYFDSVSSATQVASSSPSVNHYSDYKSSSGSTNTSSSSSPDYSGLNMFA